MSEPTVTLLGDEPPATVGDSPPRQCQYPDCTNGVNRRGDRGAFPKYCDDHRAAVKRGAAPRTDIPRQASPQLGEIERVLAQYFQYAGQGLAMFERPPETGAADGRIVTLCGPGIAHELCELAKTNKDLRKWLVFIASPGKYGPLCLAVMPLLIGIMVNHGLMPQLIIPTTTPGPASEGPTGPMPDLAQYAA